MAEAVSKIGSGRKSGTPKTGGRQKGTPNRATASIRDLARQYTNEALKALTDVLRNPDEPAAARVGAAKEILDRGYGKASTVLTGDEDGGAVKIATTIRLVGLDGS